MKSYSTAGTSGGHEDEQHKESTQANTFTCVAWPCHFDVFQALDGAAQCQLNVGWEASRQAVGIHLNSATNEMRLPNKCLRYQVRGEAFRFKPNAVRLTVAESPNLAFNARAIAGKHSGQGCTSQAAS